MGAVDAIERANKDRVLIIRIGHLGDSVLATTILDPLRTVFGGDLCVDFAAGPGASAAILQLDQRVNRVFPIAHRRLHWRLDAGKRQLQSEASKRPYDLVVNLECGSECDDFARFVAHREFCGRPFANPQHSRTRHCVDTEKSIYEGRLGHSAVRAAQPRLQVDPEALPGGPATSEPLVILNPGFAGLGREDYRGHRAWPARHWMRLIETITGTTGWVVAVNGTQAEQPLLGPLLKPSGVRSLVGSSLPELVSAIRSARCVVSVDTGTMHLAAALGTPVVALFGPTIPALTGPYSKDIPVQVLTSRIGCQPCDRTAALKRCGANRCMAGLQPAAVFAALQEIATRQPMLRWR